MMMRFLSHKKYHILAFCFLLLMLLVPMIVTHAQESAGTDAISRTHSAVTGTGWSIAGSIVGGFVHWIEQLLLSLAAFILWLCGMVFDIVIVNYVARFGETYTEYRDTVVAIWTLVRDLCNLMFIFGFIYIGIMTILNPEKASTKKFLGSLIVCAILINFSLYFTQLIIDISNFVATQIYASFPTDKGISLAVTEALHLDGFWTNLTPDALKKLGDSTGAEFSFYLGAFIFILVTALMLLFAALLLFVRFVELIIIMMFSPIIFGARVFPQTKKYSDSITQKLLSQSFFAPAYLFLLFVTLKVVNTLGAPQTPFNDLFASGAKGGASSGTSAFQVIIIFIIGIIMLWKSLELAKKSGLHGSDFVINSANSTKKWAQNSVTSTRKWAQDVAGRTAGGASGFVGRGAVRTINAGLKKTSFGDLGNAGDRAEKMRKVLRGSDSKALKAAGVLWGGVVNPLAKAAQGTTEAKFGSQRSIKDVDKANAEYKKANAEYTAEQENKIKFEQALKDVADPTKDLAKAAKDIADSMKKLSNEKIGNMSQKQLTDARIASNLTDDQMKYLKEKKSALEYKEIEDKRKEALEHIATYGDAVLDSPGNRIMTTARAAGRGATAHREAQNHIRTTRQKLLGGDVEKISAKYFTDVLQAEAMLPLTDPAKLEKRLSVGDLTGVDKDKIRINIETYVAKLKASSTPADKSRLKKWEKALSDKIELSNLGVTI